MSRSGVVGDEKAASSQPVSRGWSLVQLLGCSEAEVRLQTGQAAPISDSMKVPFVPLSTGTQRNASGLGWAGWTGLGSCVYELLRVVQAQIYLTVENEVEVAQFISSRPGSLQLTSSFHRALHQLPAVYDQTAYRRLIEDYGTHYLRRGSLGGSYRMLYMVDKDRFSEAEISEEKRSRCSQININLFIVKYYDSDCKQYQNAMKNALGGSSGLVQGLSNTVGGRPGFVAALSFIDVNNVNANGENYARWAGSVIENPVIIKTKLGPLDELVKGVPCAGVKRLHLQRALEDYQAEKEPCRCRACANGGRAQVLGTSCHCFCQPYTYGPTCQSGALVQQPEGGSGVDGGWSCWSGWSECRGGQRQRARRCDNPTPGPGGRGCTGNALQHQHHCLSRPPDGTHLHTAHVGREQGSTHCCHFHSPPFSPCSTVEPHCFEQDETPIRGCSDPPPMQNGYVQGLQQQFAAGTHAIYRCDVGYYLSGGDGTVRCGDDLRWEVTSLRCLRTVCGPPELGPGVSASPSQPSYSIGQQVTLSCPPHMALHGPPRITCDSGLNWDHHLSQVRCDAVPTVDTRPQVHCPAWKKLVGSACVCKMPYECSVCVCRVYQLPCHSLCVSPQGLSLPVCAMEQVSERRLRLTWCKLRSLQCLGKRFTLVNDSDCPPSPTLSPSKQLCGRCSPWETCDGSQSRCVCRSGGECSEPGIEFCVQPQGSDVEQTVSECQAGVWSCQGRTFTPTASWPCAGPSVAP
ncbi:complement component C7-like [Leucoraja erinacea]|uniref:complement component C7-like n=1 Tax=Leucoraja erinaceus TaxID=7782 RepID=UPI00245398A0|nr:complement component C7-like [Leucoraja erinacea]